MTVFVGPCKPFWDFTGPRSQTDVGFLRGFRGVVFRVERFGRSVWGLRPGACAFQA